MAAGPRARLISISDLDRDAIARWRDLGERAAEPNPFFGPDFLIPAAELVERAPQRLLVVDDDDGSGAPACRWAGAGSGS